MRSIVVVVADVLSHETLQMPFVQNDHMIQQISSAAPDPALCNAVLPRTTESGAHWQAAHFFHERHHIVSELGITVEQQAFMGRGIGPRFPHLLHDPKCRGISRNVETQNPAAVMPDDEEAVNHTKR